MQPLRMRRTKIPFNGRYAERSRDLSTAIAFNTYFLGLGRIFFCFRKIRNDVTNEPTANSAAEHLQIDSGFECVPRSTAARWKRR